jgi:hypothetical protein
MREEIFLDNCGKVFFIDFYRALYKAFILVVPDGNTTRIKSISYFWDDIADCRFYAKW